jgi:hypothetical protein
VRLLNKALKKLGRRRSVGVVITVSARDQAGHSATTHGATTLALPPSHSHKR